MRYVESREVYTGRDALENWKRAKFNILSNSQDNSLKRRGASVEGTLSGLPSS